MTAEFIVNHIMKTSDRGNDVAEAIRKLTKTKTDARKPTLQTSTNLNTEVKKQKDRQYKMEYKLELDEAFKRKWTYKDNLFKAYTLIWERCAKAM